MFTLATMLSGCSTTSLLPHQKEITVTLWSTFDETAEAFDKITPNQTRRNDLQELGFTPQVTSNIKILNYLDIMKRFLLDQSITKKSCPAPWQRIS
jgi:hypothetical protein